MSSYDLRLQTNPDLILWPGDDLICFLIEPSGQMGKPFSLPDAAFSVLKAFSRPRQPTKVFRSPTAHTLRTIQECVDQGLLIQVEPKRAQLRPSTLSESWAGFRFGDHSSLPLFQNPRRVITRRHLLSGRPIIVLDRVVKPLWIKSIYRWFFQLAFRRIDADTTRTAHVRHWISEFQPAARYEREVPAFLALSQLARTVAPTRKLILRRIHAYGSTFGDLQLRHRDVERGKGITAVFFGNAIWKDEWMSEMIFYDERQEPTIAVPIRPGRLVIFRGDLLHRAGAPSLLCPETRFSLVFKFSLP